MTPTNLYADGRCREYRAEVNARNNDRGNAISKLAYQMVGGFQAYKQLDTFAIRKVRKGARRLHDAGESYATVLHEGVTTRDGFVYAIVHPSFPGYVKVGETGRDPAERLADYQTGCPQRAYRLHSAHYFEDRLFAEKEIHARLEDDRAEGEWFRVTPEFADQHIRQLRETL